MTAYMFLGPFIVVAMILAIIALPFVVTAIFYAIVGLLHLALVAPILVLADMISNLVYSKKQDNA